MDSFTVKLLIGLGCWERGYLHPLNKKLHPLKNLRKMQGGSTPPQIKILVFKRKSKKM